MVDGQQDLMKDAKGLGFTEFFLLLKMLEQLFAFDQLAYNVVVFGVLLHAIDFYNVWFHKDVLNYPKYTILRKITS